MKFLIDESVEKLIADWLRDQKYDVMYVAESSSGITDEEVIKRLDQSDDQSSQMVDNHG